jgi:hypothetical protein
LAPLPENGIREPVRKLRHRHRGHESNVLRRSESARPDVS